MDNQTDQNQIPVAQVSQPTNPSQPSSSKFLMFAIVALIAALLGSIGTYLALKQSNPPPQNIVQTPPSPTPIPDPTADWKTYANSVFGFELKYPQDFTINDTLPKVNKETVSNQSLEIGNIAIPENPQLTIWVNPLGFGLTPPDIRYELNLIENNGLKVAVRTEIQQTSEGMSNIDNKTVIIGNNIKSGTNTYVFQFVFKTGGKDYEPVFKQILSTFRFSP